MRVPNGIVISVLFKIEVLVPVAIAAAASDIDFDVAFPLAVLTAYYNTIIEDCIVSRKVKTNTTMLVSAAVPILLNTLFLIYIQRSGHLRNLIAFYGVPKTTAVIAAVILGLRIIAIVFGERKHSAPLAKNEPYDSP